MTFESGQQRFRLSLQRSGASPEIRLVQDVVAHRGTDHVHAEVQSRTFSTILVLLRESAVRGS